MRRWRSSRPRRRSTHHVLVFLEEPGRKDIDDPDRKPGEPTFPGWTPRLFREHGAGATANRLSEGYGEAPCPREGGSSSRFTTLRNGSPASNRTRMGLHLRRTRRLDSLSRRAPPRKSSSKSLRLTEPRGRGGLRVREGLRILLSFFPHMHLRGKAYRYELTYPDQRREVLLNVPRYDFNWQLSLPVRRAAPGPGGHRS